MKYKKNVIALKDSRITVIITYDPLISNVEAEQRAIKLIKEG